MKVTTSPRSGGMRGVLTTALICAALSAAAQDYAAYYSDATGKKGATLKTALSYIINPHTQRSYKDLWTDFRSTDARPDGKVWDMYSAVTNYTFGTDQAGNYSKEGDVYNREHSFPKSWFNDEYPMYTDLYHLYPTDGYVNGRRSNYPFGEVSNPTWSSQKSFCLLGPCSTPGYSGTVFEPADEYKGDFARTYFYMITSYESRIQNWDCDMLDGKKYPGFSKWALDMLLRWSELDPVSEKETDRIEAVYKIQGNRNPFIDYPGLEQYIWGKFQNEAFAPDAYLTPEQITSIFEAPTDEEAAPEVYDLSGRRVNAPEKGGIYIVGGRKVIR